MLALSCRRPQGKFYTQADFDPAVIGDELHVADHVR
jgi:hypothetical protein